MKKDDLTFSDGILVSEAAERGICQSDELVQHHAGHVTLREIGESQALAVLELSEPEVLYGGVDNVVVRQHHALRGPSGAGGVHLQGPQIPP